MLDVSVFWTCVCLQDFEADPALKDQLISSMNHILSNDGSTNLEQKFAAAIIR